MEDFTMAEFGVFLGVIGGVLTSLILTVQKSRCKNIKCCGMECQREIKEKPPTPPAPDAGASA
jgi:hypothetical protein